MTPAARLVRCLRRARRLRNFAAGLPRFPATDDRRDRAHRRYAAEARACRLDERALALAERLASGGTRADALAEVIAFCDDDRSAECEGTGAFAAAHRDGYDQALVEVLRFCEERAR